MAGFKRRGKKLNTFQASRRSVPQGKHRLQVTALADDGRGIAREQGKTVFVEGALPGETVNALYVATHRQFDEARTEQVLIVSDERTEPPCAHFGVCGGCRLQHLKYDAQLRYKQQDIEHRLQRLHSAQVAVDVELVAIDVELIGAQEFHYRHRARFSVFADRDGCRFGFKRHNSNQVTDIERCHLVVESINLLLPSLKALIAQLQGRSSVAEVSVVEDSNGRMAVLLGCRRQLGDVDLSALQAFCDSRAIVLSVLLQNRDQARLWSPAGQVNSLQYRVDGGEIALQFQTEDFTQVNPAVNELMLQRALEWLQLSGDDHVLDLFCGIGNFSLPMSKRAGSVTGIELGESMVERARHNARGNGIGNAQFIAADLTQPVGDLPGYCEGSHGWNKALLDPPRAGAERLCRVLGDWGIGQLVYISCNPNTFFRDAAILQQQGYQLQRIAVADMFPQTAHSELIGLFTLVA